MDGTEEGLLLIATTMIVLVAFALTVMAVMIIYRKRRMQHDRDLNVMQEKFQNELLQMQLEAQHQTMQSIGQEIHDSVAQKLTLAKIITQQLNPWDERSTGKLAAIASTIDESLSELRALSTRLDEGIAKATLPELLQAECNRLQRANLEVSFSSQVYTLRESNVVRNFVFRIIQEFLQNSLRHSGCSQIGVVLSQDRVENLIIKAWDNGVGFDPKNGKFKSGNGLRNMKSRAIFLNASFELQSSGSGTSMLLTVPAHNLSEQ